MAERIAVGALRYFMLKFTRNSVIAFDFHEALSFEGDTGPYVQYAIVRAAAILKKFTDQVGALPAFETALNRDVLTRCLGESEDLWQLALLASKAGTAVERAIASGEPAHVAKYAFQLAQSFNNFYHEHNVMNEKDCRATHLIALDHNLRSRTITQNTGCSWNSAARLHVRRIN